MNRDNNNKFKSLNNYYMYGIHAVISALNNPKRKIINIFCTKEFFNNYSKLFSFLPYEIVENKFLDKILGKNYPHQGIIANVITIFSNNIKDVDYNDPNCKIAILDQITDPQNIGSIIRSAVGFGISAILLPKDNSPDESSSIAKAAAGALEFIKVIQVVNIKNSIEFLKSNGFWIIGLDVNGEEKITNKLFKNKIAIVLGSEDKGLRKLTKENCDFLIKIPISNNLESLNVSNAASIIFYLANN